MKMAIMLSGTITNFDFVDAVQGSFTEGNDVATLLDCSRAVKDVSINHDEVLECLRSKTAEYLALDSAKVIGPKDFSTFLTPHDQFLPMTPWAAVNCGFFQSADVFARLTSKEFDLCFLYRPN